MEGVPLFEVSKLLRHASIQMTERYAHLAPDYLHDAVASLGFSARFQHSEKPKETVLYQNGLKAVENGGRGWIWTSDPCRVKAVLSTVYNVKSTTYAHRSRVYVTGIDWSGHI